MLKLQNIHKTFYPGTVNENPVLRGLDLTLTRGDFVTVIGGNGAGKSTLLNAIAGTFKVNQGTIVLDEEDITDQSEVQRAQSISRVFQDPLMGTSPRMTVKENLKIALHRGEERKLRNTMDQETEDYFRDLLQSVDLGLEDRLDAEMATLSGGQRQVIALLMATIKQPKILLLDEHTAALDPKASELVMELTDQRIREDQLTSLMITHNMKDALAYGNRLIMLDRGKVVLDIRGQEKEDLTIDGLLDLFLSSDAVDSVSDAMLIDAKKSL